MGAGSFCSLRASVCVCLLSSKIKADTSMKSVAKSWPSREPSYRCLRCSHEPDIMHNSKHIKPDRAWLLSSVSGCQHGKWCFFIALLFNLLSRLMLGCHWGSPPPFPSWVQQVRLRRFFALKAPGKSGACTGLVDSDGQHVHTSQRAVMLALGNVLEWRRVSFFPYCPTLF